MTITIIIPALNEEKYIPQTLASIRNLDRQPDEIIVVDANSTDKTAQLAKAAGARIITVDRRSIGYSRQKGLEAATGDIVVYTDADTILPTDWLSTILTLMEKRGAPDDEIKMIRAVRDMYNEKKNRMNPGKFRMG